MRHIARIDSVPAGVIGLVGLAVERMFRSLKLLIRPNVFGTDSRIIQARHMASERGGETMKGFGPCLARYAFGIHSKIGQNLQQNFEDVLGSES